MENADGDRGQPGVVTDGGAGHAGKQLALLDDSSAGSHYSIPLDVDDQAPMRAPASLKNTLKKNEPTQANNNAQPMNAFHLSSLKSIVYDPSKSQVHLSNMGSRATLPNGGGQNRGRLPLAFNSDRKLITDFAKFNQLSRVEAVRKHQQQLIQMK